MDEKLSLKRKIMQFQTEMLDIEIIKAKEGYGYHYADLDSIIDVIVPILNRIGIGYYHYNGYDSVNKRNTLCTTLFNFDYESQEITSITGIDPDAVLAKMNQFMVEGSAITYFRRYHLTTMLGLTTDEDSDAAGKRPTEQKPGRSVEAAGKQTKEVDYIAIFKNLVIRKERKSVEKTFETYKKQLNNDDIKAIEIIIKEAYENN